MQFKYSLFAPALVALLFAGPALASDDELEITMEVMDSSDDFDGNEMTLEAEEEQPATDTSFLSDLIAEITQGNDDDDAERDDGVDLRDDGDFADLNDGDHDIADDLTNDDVREDHEVGDEDAMPDGDLPNDEMTDEEVIEEEPVEEESMDEEPVDEEPVDEEPMDEEPMDEEPMDEEPVDEEPVEEEVSNDMEATDDAVVD
jgi:hypothetical protein